MVVLLSYFVVEYDGLAPTGLDNTTINILLTKGDGDLDGSINFLTMLRSLVKENVWIIMIMPDWGVVPAVIGVHTILVHHRT